MLARELRTNLLRMTNAYQVSQAIHVAAVLGIADVLKAGPRKADEIARETGADPDATYRLMRALAAVAVFHEDAGRTFSLTPMSELLVTGAPHSLRDYAIWIGQESDWTPWGNLLIGVKTGKNVFPQIYGESVWEYRSKRPELSALFTRAIAATKVEGAVLELYDFSDYRKIIDVGGGDGTMLATVLAANPNAHGVLFDQNHVLTSDRITTAGVADRCDLIGGSFFEQVPSGGDLYMLRAVIHDWDDENRTASQS